MARPPLKLTAHAKTNLSLRVLGRRKDGYHEVETVMIRLGFGDLLTIREPEPGESPGLRCSDSTLPTDENNLVVKAWQVLERECGYKLPVVIELDKRIPHGAGLGGGSSDAAETLLGLVRFFELELSGDRLFELAKEIGSDVSFFLCDGVCRARGRGEVIEELADFDWELPMLLIKPPYGVGSQEAYQGWSEHQALEGVSSAVQICPWGEMVNDLEGPVFAKYLQLADMKEWLRAQPEVFAPLMSGSGSTMMAVLASESGGEQLLERARAEFGDTIWGWVGRTMPVMS